MTKVYGLEGSPLLAHERERVGEMFDKLIRRAGSLVFNRRTAGLVELREVPAGVGAYTYKRAGVEHADTMHQLRIVAEYPLEEIRAALLCGMELSSDKVDAAMGAMDAYLDKRVAEAVGVGSPLMAARAIDLSSVEPIPSTRAELVVSPLEIFPPRYGRLTPTSASDWGVEMYFYRRVAGVVWYE